MIYNLIVHIIKQQTGINGGPFSLSNFSSFDRRFQKKGNHWNNTINNIICINMKRFLSGFAKTLPIFQRKVFFFTMLYLLDKQNYAFPSVKCLTNPKVLRETIENLSKNVIDIYYDGKIVGSAYCFQENYLVTVCSELQQDKGKVFEYYLGEEKLKGSFRQIGNFQNLTFIECTLTKQFSPIPKCNFSPSSYEQIQIVQKKEYISLKKGHFISKDSGYGIIDGQGGLGGLIIQNGGVHGIIAQQGTQNASGFVRMIQWSKLPRLLQFAKGNKIHLGISAQSHPRRQGIQVVRIAPNSPFSRDVLMGDFIVSANGHSFRDPESLYRICLQSDGPLSLQLLRDGIPIHITVSL